MDTTLTKHLRWMDTDLHVVQAEYIGPPHGRIALRLIDCADGSPFATATINVPELELQPNEVIISHTWDENDGILAILQQAGIISTSSRFAAFNHISDKRVGYDVHTYLGLPVPTLPDVTDDQEY